MDEQQINKTIGYGILVIIAYHIIGVFIPMLTFGVIGLVVWRIYQEFNKYKK